MNELTQVEVGAELAIHTGEQVEIESGRHSEFVVVGSQKLRTRFFQIGSQQQRIARFKNAADFRQKLCPRRTVEVPDSAAQKEHQQMLAALPIRSHFEQPIEIFALKTNNTDAVNISELPLAHGERRA